MGVHRIHVDGGVEPGLRRVEGEEALHAARVKRVDVGEAVDVLDGRGAVGKGTVAGIDKVRGKWCVDVRIANVERVEPERPRLEVCTAIPKGGRLSEMISGLAQVGAAVWRPLETQRGERGEWRKERVEAIAREASKQSGRAWMIEIGEDLSLAEAVQGEGVVVADASGERFVECGEAVRLLIGPEGGWTESELNQAREAGARVCRFGMHIMRIETAAVAASAIVMAGS